ncbi:MAG TPA: phosphate ABC transporter substrate-binding protein PstS [Candidatus Binataceae bacterium]|nr:phosphate ABC transporter substrate-binding protein PstS [Candidatus Binataceae bacterium]
MIKGNSARLRLAGAFVLACCALPLATGHAIAASVQLSETGSTLLFPLFKLWIPDYVAANPNVTITPHATGSGVGISAAISDSAAIGASDAYMSDQTAEHNPQIVNIPLAISALTVNYNLPGIGGSALKLDGPTLAGIYSGTIREWDAAPIKALNPGVMLPHHAIIPIRRADASGDTFIFTQFLDFSTSSWEDKIGYGLTVAWPNVPGEMTAAGNRSMLRTVAATQYSIAYIGISFADEIAKAGLGTAMLKNQSGKFLLPTAETISAAASVLDPRTPPDERLSLVFAPGDNSYPLINYEYVVVSTRQPNPAAAKILRDFLLWANSPLGGNTPKYLDAVHFIPLPDFIRALSENQINKIK